MQRPSRRQPASQQTNETGPAGTGKIGLTVNEGVAKETAGVGDDRPGGSYSDRRFKQVQDRRGQPQRARDDAKERAEGIRPRYR